MRPAALNNLRGLEPQDHRNDVAATLECDRGRPICAVCAAEKSRRRATGATTQQAGIQQLAWLAPRKTADSETEPGVDTGKPPPSLMHSQASRLMGWF